MGEFETRLRREVAIETGLIERLYQFDRGVTVTLVEQGIRAALIPHDAGESPELVVAMIQDADNNSCYCGIIDDRYHLPDH